MNFLKKFFGQIFPKINNNKIEIVDDSGSGIHTYIHTYIKMQNLKIQQLILQGKIIV